MATDPGFRTFVVIMSGLFLGGTVALILGAVFLRRLLRYRGFPSVRGELLDSHVTSAYNEGRSFWPHASYRYEVGGARLTSDRIFSVSPVGASKRWAEQLIDELRQAPELKVYYDPERPNCSFLKNGPVTLVVFLGGIGLTFLAISIFFTWPWLSR